MNAFEKKIKQNILAAADHDLSAITPGLCLQVVQRGRLCANLRLGDTHKYYDLASLTKIIFTTSAMMSIAEDRRISLNDSVSHILPWWPHKPVLVRELLSHSGGLPWWAPFYITLRRVKGLDHKREKLREMLTKTVIARKGRHTKAIYSDLDFLMLGFVLEAIYEQPLIEIWQNIKWREYAPGFHFNMNNKPTYKRSLYAPTEKCPWRKKILRGEVHDDNTWSMGGVSSHAGLFGTIDDVTAYGELLRNAYLGKNKFKNFVGTSIVRQFTRRAIQKAQGDWALGFILPTKGSASCGRYFHSSSFGHTGFTGTSLWYDPKKDLLVTILSNRVHPTRENSRYVQFRPVIHNIVCEALS